MPDRLETFGNSRIQHGKESNRIYLMELEPADLPGLLARLDQLGRRAGYGKIFAKVPASALAFFLEEGYRTEALVPGFFKGREPGHFMAKYLDPARAETPEAAAIETILAEIRPLGAAPEPGAAPAGFDFRSCTPADLEAMAALYRETFASYPFPIHDPDFLARTMAEHVLYFGVWQEGKLLALASAEQYPEHGHAEMTDFATRSAARGRGLASLLLVRMTQAMQAKGLKTAYTIARANSPGMNRVFARTGYRFGGTLINNTQISGRIESMNVWYRPLQ